MKNSFYWMRKDGIAIRKPDGVGVEIDLIVLKKELFVERRKKRTRTTRSSDFMGRAGWRIKDIRVNLGGTGR